MKDALVRAVGDGFHNGFPDEGRQGLAVLAGDALEPDPLFGCQADVDLLARCDARSPAATWYGDWRQRSLSASFIALRRSGCRSRMLMKAASCSCGVRFAQSF